MRKPYKKGPSICQIYPISYIKIWFSKWSHFGNMVIFLTFWEVSIKYMVKLFLCCFIFFSLSFLNNIIMQGEKKERKKKIYKQDRQENNKKFIKILLILFSNVGLSSFRKNMIHIVKYFFYFRYSKFFLIGKQFSHDTIFKLEFPSRILLGRKFQMQFVE